MTTRWLIVLALALAGCPHTRAGRGGMGGLGDMGSGAGGGGEADRVGGAGEGSATCTDGGVGETCLAAGHPRFSAGLTPPVRLLDYRDSPQLPAYCHRDAILDKIGDLAAHDHCTCQATQLGGAPTRVIVCDLNAGSDPGCAVQYVAVLWQERWSSSTEDYDLEMFARVRAECGREEDFETFHASDEITAQVTAESADVTNLLANCEAHSLP
jgi:hypothetical protein